MELYYKGKNIYSDVKIKECIYDSRCDTHLSYLRIVFEDENHKFDSYGIENGDEIRLKDGNIDTKKLYINNINPDNARFEIVAHPVMREAMEETDNKKWKSVKFKKIINDIATKHGLTTEYFGVENNQYKNIEQNNERDIMFAARMAILEGCIAVLFNGKLIVASKEYLKSQSVDDFEIDNYNVVLKRKTEYKKCIVQGTEKTGKYTSASGSGTIIYRIEVSSKAEGNRFAENLLKYKNKNAHTGCVTTEELKDGYSGGTVVTIKSEDHPSAKGKALIDRVRHDLINGKSKIWFECLEG